MWLGRSGLRRNRRCHNLNKDALVSGCRANATGDCDRVEPDRLGGRYVVCDDSGRIRDECPASSSAALDRASSSRDFFSYDQRDLASRANADWVHRLLERDCAYSVFVSVAAL